MAIHFVKIVPLLILTLSLVALLHPIHSLSSIAISETGNQTLVCALTQSPNRTQSLNCTVFPQRTQISLNPPFQSISGIVSGIGFVCALSSFYSSSISVMVCWRFSIINNSTNMSYTRVYFGPVLNELDSGNSHICGLNSSSSLHCWQWQNQNDTNIFSSKFAVGEDFVCGLSNLSQVRCLGNYANVTDTDRIPTGEFSQVSVGFRHACALFSFNGSLRCWGDMAGEPPEGDFKGVSLGENRGCAIRHHNETVICWGENGFSLPASLQDESFIILKAKRRVFCGVLMRNFSLICWGNEDFDSNTLVFNHVIPGPCRPRNECDGYEPLQNYAQYCSNELMICLPNVVNHVLPEIPSPPLLSPMPSPPMAPSRPSNTGSQKRNHSVVAFLVVGCIGCSSSLLVVCVFLFGRYFKIRGSRIHDSGRLEEGGEPQEEGDQIAQPRSAMEKKLSHLISMGNGHLEEFSFDLLVKVTENFSEEHKIGSGSFGSVYNGKLDDGREVAIKRAETFGSSSYAGATKRGQEDKDIAFLNELEFLSRLNHKNLVRLFGYCEHFDERVLVYEFMDNGTLLDHLHKLESSPLMSWATRIKVALDAARGIEYLHEFAVPHVIHRDIKCSNILLDATWNAKVSDFGLSLLGPQEDEAHLSLLAAGTMGYMDPEYYRLQLLTNKSDVYSFGIVLLELLSGYRAIHKNESGELRNVVDCVVPYIIQDKVHRILDRRLPPPTPFEIEAVAYVGYLAADCVMPEGCDRPTMSEVVNGLDKALETCLAPSALSRSTMDSSE